MPNNDFLYVDAQNVRAEIATLLEAYPELAEDEELRLDMLEGETDLREIVSRALDVRQEAETMSAAIKLRIADLGTRKARYDKRGEAMKRLIKSIMQTAQQDKLALPDASLSITKPRESVNVIDLDALPQGYFKIERKADRTAIKEAIQSGETIPAAELALGESGLTIRVK